MATRLDTVRDTVGWTSGVNLGTGIWLIIAPFILGYSMLRPAVWNDVVVGILVAILAGARIGGPLRHPGYSWFNAGIGVWLIIAPFILPYRMLAATVGTAATDTAATTANVAVAGVANVGHIATWNDVICGVILLILGVISASATRKARANTLDQTGRV